MATQDSFTIKVTIQRKADADGDVVLPASRNLEKNPFGLHINAIGRQVTLHPGTEDEVDIEDDDLEGKVYEVLMQTASCRDAVSMLSDVVSVTWVMESTVVQSPIGWRFLKDDVFHWAIGEAAFKRITDSVSTFLHGAIYLGPVHATGSDKTWVSTMQIDCS